MRRRSREAIDKKVLTISQKQEERIRSLERELREVTRRVSALFANASVVNTAIVVINQYLSQGVQWDVLQEQVRAFQQKPYNVFHHIKSLDLEHNRMKMVFEVVDDEWGLWGGVSGSESGVSGEEDGSGEEDVSEDDADDGKSDAEKNHQINVDVELSLNCNNNIALLYKQKKELEEKLVRPLRPLQPRKRPSRRRARPWRRPPSSSRRRSCAWSARSRRRSRGGGRSAGSRSSTGS